MRTRAVLYALRNCDLSVNFAKGELERILRSVRLPCRKTQSSGLVLSCKASPDFGQTRAFVSKKQTLTNVRVVALVEPELSWRRNG